MHSWLYCLTLTLMVTYSLANNTTGIPECTANEDCLKNRVCTAEKCVNPCAKVCGSHTQCDVINHIIMCYCSSGYMGNPKEGCTLITHLVPNIPPCKVNDDCRTDRVCVKEKCVNPCGEDVGVCGLNTDCDVTDHVIMCSCSPGFTGHPRREGCSLIDASECATNEDCAYHKACARHKCVDPCVGACGTPNTCRVINHVARCSIRPDSSRCTEEFPFPPDLPGASGCSSPDQCPASKTCINGKCKDACEGLCGENASCTVRSHFPSCDCNEGYTGNPFSSCASFVVSGTWPPYPHGKKRFYLENSKTGDFSGANIGCLKNNTRLASIYSMEELEEIRGLIKQTGKRHGQYWTSGSDYGYEGNYVWVSTGKPFIMASRGMWLTNQPDNFFWIEHCVEVWEASQHEGYGLNDRLCIEHHNYICEYYE